MNHTLRIALLNAILMIGGTLAWPHVAAAQTAVQAYQIKTGDLDSALQQWASQSGQQLMYSGDLVAGKRSAGLSGSYVPAEALQRLLDGSGLESERLNLRTIVLKKAAPTLKAPTKLQPAAKPSVQAEGKVTELPEILVTGTRSLNADIERTRDDPQPYAIINRESIQRSGATTIEDLLKQQLPMNTVGQLFSQQQSALGNRSSINLRGLGENQTLILVDGRRLSTINSSSAVQSDINGIPLAAVERIEILPTTASGIYGGSATGGVVNIVLRRDYTGLETKFTYENTFKSGAAGRRIDIGGGFTLSDDKTEVLIAGSFSERNDLLARDRDFIQRGRAFIQRVNPQFFVSTGDPIPPRGRTTNIRSADGSDLVLDDGTPLNAAYSHVPLGYTGIASDGGAALVANAGSFNFDLAAGAQSLGGGDAAVVNSPTVKSLMSTIRHEFTPSVHGFLELGASENVGHFVASNVGLNFELPASAPNNPFRQAILVTAPTAAADTELLSENEDRRVVGGLIIKLPHEWQAAGDYTWHRASSSSDFGLELTSSGHAALAEGTIDVIRDTNAVPLDLAAYLKPGPRTSDSKSTLKNIALRFAGPMGRLPGGIPQISVLFEHRDQILGAQLIDFDPSDPNGLVSPLPERSQKVDSIYVEARLPFVSANNAKTAVQELELQIAGRWDDYTNRGAGSAGVFARTDPAPPITRTKNTLTSVDPTIALRYRPIEDVVLRASYGTGFLPPDVSQLAPGGPFPPRLLGTDPRRNNEPVVANFFSGGNPQLKPEESESWSLGTIITSRVVPDLRVSLDWTRIRKVGNIASDPGGSQAYIDNEMVVRGPVPPGDPFGVGPITTVNLFLLNLAKAEVEALDLQLDYRFVTKRFGTFDFSAIGTRQTHHKTQTAPDRPVVENVGINYTNPLRTKANLAVGWSSNNWSANWIARYFDSYITEGFSASFFLNQSSFRVPSQTYHDVSATWRPGAFSGDMEIQLGIRNVFNKKPPFDAIDPYFYSPFGDPRLSSYYLSVSRRF